jgi:hypothetical protein
MKVVLKICEFCNGAITNRPRATKFCSGFCQRKAYNLRPEIREKNRMRTREYRKTHPEWKERHRILAVTRHREKRAKYWKEYGKKPGVRERINKIDRERRKHDKRYAVADRLRRSLHHALTKYSKSGKIMSSKKYGIDWQVIIKSLEPFPSDIENFEIDHIIPLHTFDLTNPKEIIKAFSPSNLQWLSMGENRKKGGKLISNNFITIPSTK